MRLAAITACFLALAAPGLAAPFTFAPLTVPNGSFTATGLNDAGVFVGTFRDGTPAIAAATYADGVATRLNLLYDGGFTFYNLRGLNDAGLLVGSTGHRFANGFAYRNGNQVDSGIPVSFSASANDANNRGQVVGDSFLFGGTDRGVLVTDGVTTLFDVPGAAGTTPYGINDLGQIVGTYAPSGATELRGFLLDDGAFTDIAVPGARNTRPLAINNAGTVVGTYADALFNQHGFLESGGQYADITGPDGAAFLPVGLNNAGQIVGTFGGTGLSYLGTPADAQPVPEPSSLALLVTGTAVLGAAALASGGQGHRPQGRPGTPPGPRAPDPGRPRRRSGGWERSSSDE